MAPEKASDRPCSDTTRRLAWRRVALGGAGGMFVGMGLGRFSYTAMVPPLVEAGALDAVEAGRVGMANLVVFLAGAVLSVPLARRWPGPAVPTAAVLLCLLALAMSAVPAGFLWLACWRGLAGFGTGLVMVLSLALIGATAPAAERATAAGYVFAGVGLGICSSGLLVPALVRHGGVLAAWTGLAAAGALGALVAIWGWRGAPPGALRQQPDPASTAAAGRDRPASALARPGLPGLVAAHVLFGFGIVPHTLYWVDHLVRDLVLGQATGGLHWSLAGLFAFLGPLIAAALARRIGTAPALVLAFLAIGTGVGAPALSPLTPVLVASSVLFGAQPGLSSLMAARARDLGDPARVTEVMRAMILSSASGGALGGVAVPWLYGLSGSRELVFMCGGAALLAAAAMVLPWRR